MPATTVIASRARDNVITARCGINYFLCLFLPTAGDKILASAPRSLNFGR